MSYGKGKGNKPRASRPSGLGDGLIDARPGETESPPTEQEQNKLKNIQQTKAWQNTTSGVKHVWAMYLHSLSASFVRMTRAEQLELIDKGSMVVTIGVTILVLAIIYPMLPSILRLFLTPTLIGGAWLFSKRVVTPVMVSRCANYLNNDVEM
jgi:hypothetical protein